jgi:hypothetical protein
MKYYTIIAIIILYIKQNDIIFIVNIEGSYTKSTGSSLLFIKSAVE